MGSGIKPPSLFSHTDSERSFYDRLSVLRQLYGRAAFYTFIQVLIMAMVFAFFLYQLYKRGTRIIWLVLAVCFYAFLPINGLLTICMGKDEFFTAVLLLFMWMTVEFDLDAAYVHGGGSQLVCGFLCISAGDL